MNVEQRLLILTHTQAMTVWAFKAYHHLTFRQLYTSRVAAEYPQVREDAQRAWDVYRESRETLYAREHEPVALELEWTN